MRLLYFGDKHERVTSPENRLDNYRETQKLKTKEIKRIGRENKVVAYLQPGDFFDTANPPLDFVSEVVEEWTGQNLFEVFTDFVSGNITQEEAMTAMKGFTPMIGVAGNHELFGNNISTLSKTAIGFLTKLGLMKFATKQNPYIITTNEGLKVAITGTHYHLDIDHPEYLDDYIVEEKLGDYHIHIVHGTLSDKDMGKFVRHTLVDQIRHTKADLTITGHDHIGFNLVELDGKYFVNPGAPVRQSNDLKEMKRVPQVMLIDITRAHGLRTKMIPLQSAQAGELVLNRRKIVERKKREDRLEEFKKAVREAGIKKSTDITEIIRDIAANKMIPQAIRDDIINRISEKKSQMSIQVGEVLKEAYVLKLVMENFQSHTYTELDFSNGLNLFIGESRQGKTAVLRAFQWLYENKPTGKRIIKKKAEYAKVTAYLSNGYIVSRFIERKASGKNGYYITDPTVGEEEYHNTKILPEVQRILGYNPFVIDKDLSFNLNFMKQGSGWFLIGDSYSAPVKAKIIGGIYGTQYTDAVARDLDAEDKKINENVKSAQTELAKIDEQITEYHHLEDLGNSIQGIEQLLKEIDELNARKEKTQSLLLKRKQLEQVVKENEDLIGQLSNLEQANLMVEQIKVQALKRTQLSGVIGKRKEAEGKLKALMESLDATKDLDQAMTLFAEVVNQQKKAESIRSILVKRNRITTQIKEDEMSIAQTARVEEAGILLQEIQAGRHRRKELQEKMERAKRLEESRKDVSMRLETLYETLRKTENLEEARHLFAELDQRLTEKAQIEKVISSRKRLSTQIANEDAVIKKQNNETALLVSKYKGLLEDAGSCPVCHNTIDKTTADRIVQEYQSA